MARPPHRHRHRQKEAHTWSASRLTGCSALWLVLPSPRDEGVARRPSCSVVTSLSFELALELGLSWTGWCATYNPPNNQSLHGGRSSGEERSTQRFCGRTQSRFWTARSAHYCRALCAFVFVSTACEVARVLRIRTAQRRTPQFSTTSDHDPSARRLHRTAQHGPHRTASLPAHFICLSRLFFFPLSFDLPSPCPSPVLNSPFRSQRLFSFQQHHRAQGPYLYLREKCLGLGLVLVVVLGSCTLLPFPFPFPPRIRNRESTSRSRKPILLS